jgi:3-hydroxybutyryl-CoA dehydrogenase
MAIKNVGIVGCGLMGSGITQVCAQSGYQVVVSEINDELLNKGIASISSRLTRDVEKSKLAQQDKESIIARIKGTTNVADFADCDLVIEAATENMELKKKIFAELDKICPKDTILATNTSVLPVTEIARETGRSDNVLGLHFFNPVPIMKLVEIIRTSDTSDETLEVAKKLCDSLGKTFVIAQDTPGFIVNRLLTPFLLNAIRMLEDNIATKEDIDTAVHLGLNHPAGPLTLLDLIGVDSVFAAASAVYEETKDPQYAPPTSMKKMVDAGWLGRKTGKGFYEYKSE